MPITDLPRLMVAAASSGSGKTTVVCTLLELLRRRSCQAAAFKSGPDYIDPVLDTPSYNLDLFLLGRNEPGRDTACRILGRHGRQKEIAILEGAMGYYDGIGMGSEASAYELASATGTPVVLVVDGRGSALTLAAVLKGMAAFQPDCRFYRQPGKTHGVCPLPPCLGRGIGTPVAGVSAGHAGLYLFQPSSGIGDGF